MTAPLIFPDVKSVPSGNWPWFNFTPQEMACHGTGQVKVDPDFMGKLQALRERLGFALPITSGYRSPEHNAKVSQTGLTGPHTTGRAVDIAIYGERAYLLMAWAADFGFTGIGWKQRGSFSQRFIHLDDLTSPDWPRPGIWSYK